MEMKVKIYTTPTCGICKMAKKKMMDKNIEFEEYNLEDYVEELDIETAPVLQIDDDTFLTSPLQINAWINEQ